MISAQSSTSAPEHFLHFPLLHRQIQRPAQYGFTIGHSLHAHLIIAEASALFPVTALDAIPSKVRRFYPADRPPSLASRRLNFPAGRCFRFSPNASASFGGVAVSDCVDLAPRARESQISGLTCFTTSTIARSCGGVRGATPSAPDAFSRSSISGNVAVISAVAANRPAFSLHPFRDVSPARGMDDDVRAATRDCLERLDEILGQPLLLQHLLPG